MSFDKQKFDRARRIANINGLGNSMMAAEQLIDMLAGDSITLVTHRSFGLGSSRLYKVAANIITEEKKVTVLTHTAADFLDLMDGIIKLIAERLYGSETEVNKQTSTI